MKVAGALSFLVVLGACSTKPAPRADVPADAGATADAAANGAPSDVYPAFRVDVPQLQKHAGAVLTAPRFVPVYFAGDSVAQYTTPYLKALAASGEWRAMVAEYGVGAATVASDVVRADAPASVTQHDIETWLAGMLDGTHAEFGAPDPGTIYVLFYPSTVDVTFGSKKSCADMAGIHESFTTPSGANVVYAAIFECKASASILEASEYGLSHELAEAVTDPRPDSDAAFVSLDPAHSVWTFGAGGEVADLCANLYGHESIATLDFGRVQRTWSNAAMAGYHQPCVPAPPKVYFAAAPVLTEDVEAASATTLVHVRAVRIPVGESRTIDVQLFSDGPTGGPWSVAAKVEPPASANELAFAWDRSSGQNGEILHLTITANADNSRHVTPFRITSTLGNDENGWFGAVAR